MTEEKTAGTPGQDDGDAAAAQTAGTPGSDDRNATLTPEQELEDLRREKQQWLASKDKLERADHLEQELVTAQQLLQQQARAMQTPPTMDPALAQLHSVIARTEWIANYDPDEDKRAMAGLTLAGLRRQEVAFSLSSIPDQQVRDKVEREFSTGRYADVNTAREVVEAREYKTKIKSIEELEKELEQRRKDLEDQARAQSGPRPMGAGRSIPVPAREASGPMAWSEVQAEQDRLVASGKFKEAREYINQFRRGDRKVDYAR